MPLPAFVPPQLPRLVHKVPVGDAWLFEIKYDGYRCITAVNGAEVRCYTRSGLDWTKRFGAIPAAIGALRLPGALLDGEVCVLDAGGRSSFPSLRRAAGAGLVYAVFDLLAYRGKDLRALPLLERKDRLRKLLATALAPLLYAQHHAGDGDAMFRSLCAIGCEGLVAKRADRPYTSGAAHRDWLKVKCAGYQRA